MQRRFVQVDVFSESPYLGNPLAVVLDAEGLSESDMRRFANWTNLSETTFLLPPTDPSADYRVRIFTPSEELPFAGHPTLGSAFSWLSHGGTPKANDLIVQECGVGLVTVRHDTNSLSFAAPSLLRSGPVDEPTLAEATASLGINRSAVIDAAWVDNGPGFLGLLLESADDALAIRPRDMSLKVGVVGPYPTGSRFAYEVRAFYSSNGSTFEDPVTGSLNAALAQWLIGVGRCSAPYLASQGTAIGRAGVVHVTNDESNNVWIGGNVVTCISGNVEI